MVLHLLGKKSWNVYGGANIERVRRDEAAAQAREEAEEQRMQLEDAARRTAILRGDAPGPGAASAAPAAGSSAAGADEDAAAAAAAAAAGVPRERKRRRLRGEDDSARDIRYAREDAEAGARARQALVKRQEDNAPLVDEAGHLQLIPAPDEKAVRRAEADAEHARKRQREEERYAMRFADAAGVRTGMAAPWYAASRTRADDGREDGGSDAARALAGGPATDVWGNEDPRRQERERTRISTSDPFAAMQHAQRQLKQSQSDREQWQRARWAELEAPEPSRSAEKSRRPHESTRRRHHHHHRRRRRDSDEESLEGFSLDAPAESRRGGSEQDRHRTHRHHHRHRSRRRSRSRDEQSRRRHGSRRDAE